jgi:hypothetical protein
MERDCSIGFKNCNDGSSDGRRSSVLFQCDLEACIIASIDYIDDSGWDLQARHSRRRCGTIRRTKTVPYQADHHKTNSHVEASPDPASIKE